MIVTLQPHFFRLLLAAALACLAIVPAVGADSTRVGAYDFGYVASGETRARPVQVFDDGKNTFFQFRSGESVPAIFSNRVGVPQLLVPAHEGPYIKVAEVHGRFVLQVGRSQANVVHSGGVRADAPPLNVVAQSGLTTPYAGGPVQEGSKLVASIPPTASGSAIDAAVNRNSYATPRKGDAVQWMDPEPRREEFTVWFTRGSAVLSRDAKRAIAEVARRGGQNTRFFVVGRDDGSLKEGLDRVRAETLASALAKAGAEPSRIVTRVGVAGVPRGKSWPSTLQVESERPMAVANNAPTPSKVYPPPATQMLSAKSAPVWLVQQSDMTVANMLSRWAKEAGWTVSWTADAPVIRVTGNGRVDMPDFKAAAEVVLTDVKSKGYSIKAKAFADNVLEVRRGNE